MFGDIIANYGWLGQDAFISETILIAICSLLQNRRFCPVSKIGDLVSFKIGSFVLPPYLAIPVISTNYNRIDKPLIFFQITADEWLDIVK